MHKANCREDDGDGRCRCAQHMRRTVGCWALSAGPTAAQAAQHLDPPLVP